MGKPQQNFRKEAFELAKSEAIEYTKRIITSKCAKYSKENKINGCVDGFVDFLQMVNNLEFKKMS